MKLLEGVLGELFGRDLILVLAEAVMRTFNWFMRLVMSRWLDCVTTTVAFFYDTVVVVNYFI